MLLFGSVDLIMWYRKLYDLLQAIQEHGGVGARAAVFFASFAFFLSQLCVNVVACGVVGGMDLSALLPKCVAGIFVFTQCNVLTPY